MEKAKIDGESKDRLTNFHQLNVTLIRHLGKQFDHSAFAMDPNNQLERKKKALA